MAKGGSSDLKRYGSPHLQLPSSSIEATTSTTKPRVDVPDNTPEYPLAPSPLRLFSTSPSSGRPSWSCESEIPSLDYQSKSVAMVTNASFVHPFTSGWIRPGVLRRGRTNLIDSERNLACPIPRTSGPRQIVTSNLGARRFLLRNRRAGFGTETVYYNPDEGQEEQAKPVEADIPAEPKQEKQVVLRRTGMNTPMVLSKELQQFAGDDMMPRSKVINLLGNYIKEKDLYLKGNKREFVPDHFLSNLLGVDGGHSMLSLQKLISKHLKKPSEVGPEYVERSERMYQEYLKEKGAVDSKDVQQHLDPRGQNSLKTQKELKAKGKGMYKAVTFDPCLRSILGECDTMSRPQILQTVWNYIKKEKLQNPENRRQIIVNEGLRNALKITDADTVDCFHLGRYLWKLCKDPASK